MRIQITTTTTAVLSISHNIYSFVFLSFVILITSCFYRIHGTDSCIFFRIASLVVGNLIIAKLPVKKSWEMWVSLPLVPNYNYDQGHGYCLQNISQKLHMALLCYALLWLYYNQFQLNSWDGFTQNPHCGFGGIGAIIWFPHWHWNKPWMVWVKLTFTKSQPQQRFRTMHVKYIAPNMYRASLFYIVTIILWTLNWFMPLIYLYSSAVHHWHWHNHMIATVSVNRIYHWVSARKI